MSLDNHATRLDLLDRLKSLRSALPEQSRWGLCCHVLRIHPTSEEDECNLTIGLRELFRALGYDGVYPITTAFQPGEYLYAQTPNKWAGWQRAARIKLIDEAITYLESRV